MANEALRRYYDSLESRVGYKFILGGTRHFGFYKPGVWWPFPLYRALQAMEDHLIKNMALERGSKILDLGCGVGNVSIYLARAGYQVHGIDILDSHLTKARKAIDATGLDIQVTQGDYQNLEFISSCSVDGAFTMETFVHATKPHAAALEIFRVLRPGGSLAMYEYQQLAMQSPSAQVSWGIINKYAAMPANETEGMIEAILSQVGFEDIMVEDLSENVLPMLRLFYILAFVPYIVISLFGLKSCFINTVAGYEGYLFRDSVRYISISARKPMQPSSSNRKSFF